MIWIAADFSNWQRIPTDADILTLKNLGVRRVIIGTSFSRNNGDGTFTYIADQQMAVCEAAGFEVQEYQFIGRIFPTKRFWWLDIELLETQDEIRDAIIAHHPDGIYTRRGIWQLLDWDIKAKFPWLKLWDANYGPLPRTFIPYGGWTKADMTQWHDTMDIGTGFSVDLNVYEEEIMDAPTKAEFAALYQLVLDQKAGIDYLIKVVISHETRVKVLEAKP